MTRTQALQQAVFRLQPVARGWLLDRGLYHAILIGEGGHPRLQLNAMRQRDGG